jgi:hypothetical protein
MYKLKSIAAWVEEKTKTLYPCKVDGTAYKKNGIPLSDLNEQWFTYLDRDDREYLSKLSTNNKNN